jgi:hypothetical protein
MINLPTIKSVPSVKNPRFLVYFGKPKSGKTTVASMLPNNLIIDLENGTDFLSALVLKASNLKELFEIMTAIKEASEKSGKPPYDFITLDNGTKLQEYIMGLALKLYQETPMGKNYSGDVRKLPNGAGYLYIREAFFKVIDALRLLAPTFILICHTKDSMISRGGKELNEMSLDLVGQLSRLIAADADAIGYVYRSKNQTLINFNGGDDYIVEARQEHLRGKEIVLMESDENGQLKAHWDKIFLPNK